MGGSTSSMPPASLPLLSLPDTSGVLREGLPQPLLSETLTLKDCPIKKQIKKKTKFLLVIFELRDLQLAARKTRQRQQRRRGREVGGDAEGGGGRARLGGLAGTAHAGRLQRVPGHFFRLIRSHFELDSPRNVIEFLCCFRAAIICTKKELRHVFWPLCVGDI